MSKEFDRGDYPASEARYFRITLVRPSSAGQDADLGRVAAEFVAARGKDRYSPFVQGFLTELLQAKNRQYVALGGEGVVLGVAAMMIYAELGYPDEESALVSHLAADDYDVADALLAQAEADAARAACDWIGVHGGDTGEAAWQVYVDRGYVATDPEADPYYMRKDLADPYKTA